MKEVIRKIETMNISRDSKSYEKKNKNKRRKIEGINTTIIPREIIGMKKKLSLEVGIGRQ